MHVRLEFFVRPEVGRSTGERGGLVSYSFVRIVPVISPSFPGRPLRILALAGRFFPVPPRRRTPAFDIHSYRLCAAQGLGRGEPGRPQRGVAAGQCADAHRDAEAAPQSGGG